MNGLLLLKISNSGNICMSQILNTAVVKNIFINEVENGTACIPNALNQ